MSLLHACTFLFTPGHAPQRFEKGLRSRADGMVLDLEDAVAVHLGTPNDMPRFFCCCHG